MRGGNSTPRSSLVAGGAGGSKGALEVTGDVGDAHPVSVRRHDVLSGGPAHAGPHGLLRQEDADLPGARRRPALHAHGDLRDWPWTAFRSWYDFETGPEWQEVRLDLAKLGAADWKRVRAIGVGTMGPAGPFRFQIDDVRLE